MEQEIVDTQSCLAHCVDVTKTGIRLGGGFVSSFGIGSIISLVSSSSSSSSSI